MMDPATWTAVLEVMVKVRDAHGWNEMGQAYAT
jgi:hypothetical protein